MLFCTLPAFGHLYPMMPLALAARAAGHDVVFATGKHFVPRLRALGLETYQAGISVRQAAQELLDGRSERLTWTRLNWESVAGQLFLGRLARRTIDDLLPLLDRLVPDLVIYEQYDLGAAVAAALVETPAICHSLGRAISIEARQVLIETRLHALWRDYGRSSAPFDVFWGNAYLDIYPPSLQEPSIFDNPFRIPVRPVPWSEPIGTIPAWVTARSRPLVYLTLGTIIFGSGDGHQDDGLRTAVKGLSTLDVDVLVALGPHDPAGLEPVPAGVHLEHFVHQADLLPHVDLVVHHGGSGTTIGALSNGLPQLILPRGADQFINGDMIVSAGLGLVLEPDSVSLNAVVEAARSLLTEDSYRDAACAISKEIAAMPHPTDALSDLISIYSVTSSP